MAEVRNKSHIIWERFQIPFFPLYRALHDLSKGNGKKSSLKAFAIRISHVKTAKEAWTILETTYEGTKKVKDTKLQMLTTRFKELEMGDNESFDSFYGKLNEIIIAKLNLREKIEDAKVVRKILRSLLDNFRAKVTAIEESKDLDKSKIQELIGSLQTYELGLPSHKLSKSLALKTITVRMDDSFEEDGVEKEVAFLAKNFCKFLKMKNSGKSFSKGNFSDRKEFKKRDGKDSQSPQGIVCKKCNGHGHLKKEFPNYLRGKGKVFATNLSDSESSNSDTEGECDNEGNYRAFMAIASVDLKDDLSKLVDELGNLTKDEEVEELEDEDVCQNEGENNLQEAYDSLLENYGKYAKVVNLTMKKMKKVEEKHRCILVQLKEAKCKVEGLKGELVEAYSKIKFLELEIIQANVKVERISTKKLDNVLSSQKSSHDKTSLCYTEEGSSSSETKKEARFVSTKNDEKLKEVNPEIETPTAVKRTIGANPREKRKSLRKNQRGPQVKHMSPTKHSTTKKSSKCPRTDSDNFKSIEADMAYNEC
ncbi:uncharacterized protein LOC136067937 [Quercus suber]|uniref:uncharacterized protein LOC136067937 n=1 Tax=Quercus suber TaxID=58331 RepID=UPI0032DEAF97